MLTRLGQYEVRAQIAEGGMAIVYLGGAPGQGRGEVALKVIHPSLADDQGFIGMFLDEAKLTASLHHPNIVETYEQVNDGKNLFIAMELLLGQTLTKVWEAATHQNKPLPYELVAWIGARVCDALHYAHELTDDGGVHREVVHRDINPSNIFLTYRGQVKVIDFGLAKALGRVTTTESGVVKGKLAYMSPEQVSGVEVDRRTDLFSLGAALWEITCGRRLFKGGTDVETGKKVMAAEVPHPAVLLPGYPNELATIILRALSKDRALRYQTAADLGKDLDAFAASGADITPSVLLGIMRDLFPGDCDHDARWFENEAREAHTVPLQPLMLRMPPRTPTPPKPNGVHPVSAPPPAAPAPAAPPPLATRPASGATRPASPLDLLTQRELAMFGVLAVLALTAVAVAIVSLAR